MPMNDIDLDRIVDYRAEYTAAIKKSKVSGDSLTGLCPFHDDSEPSFSVDLKTGKYHCFACGAEGNFITFYARLNALSTKDAYKAILDKYHIAAPQKQTYTVEEYAAGKHLPAEWLVERFKLTSETDKKTGQSWIRIPYFNEHGGKTIFRKRYPPGAPVRFKWSYGSAGKIHMYGEWQLGRFREVDKRVLLVEGESDTQTLWYLQFPALGVPGASSFKAEWCKQLEGVEKLYLHIEPDRGGQTFLHQICRKLLDGGYKGKVYRWSCSEYGFKDPSAMFVELGKNEAAVKIKALLDNAEPVDPVKTVEDIPMTVEGAPIRLRQPDGWSISDAGISMVDEKTFRPRLVCRTPILITHRLRNIETGDEKIEIAFKRDDKWHSAAFPRSVIFQSKSITALADMGCTVTSENSKQLVRYLEKLEAENIDIIDRMDSASTFGWHDDNKFLPGLADNVVLDIDPSLHSLAAAYSQSGTLDGWKAAIEKHRERDIFRFILAASFTAPLLRIIKQRVFFVYNWGDSRGGKTAALKAALSAWGDPERLMVNFNATNVALERMAGFYCDLPLGIDERQLAGNRQGSLEKIVYMLSTGTSKARGAKTGGLQAIQTWRTVVLSTGEEPITTATSQTGVSTRILELYGPPFEDEQSAAEMHQLTAEHYGWAGVEFVRRLIQTGEAEIKERFDKMLAFINLCAERQNGSHAAGIAAVATADALLSEWIFGADELEARERAMVMAANIVAADAENAARDVNEGAAQYLADWIASNRKGFYGDGFGQRLGMTDGSIAYVFPSILDKALTDGGFSTSKTLKYLAELKVIEVAHEGNKKLYSIVRRFYGKPTRFVKIYLDRLNDIRGDGQIEDGPDLGAGWEFSDVEDDGNFPFDGDNSPI